MEKKMVAVRVTGVGLCSTCTQDPVCRYPRRPGARVRECLDFQGEVRHEAARLAVPLGRRIEVAGDRYVLLSSLAPEITGTFDEERLQVTLVAPAALFRTTVTQLAAQKPEGFRIARDPTLAGVRGAASQGMLLCLNSRRQVKQVRAGPRRIEVGIILRFRLPFESKVT